VTSQYLPEGTDEILFGISIGTQSRDLRFNCDFRCVMYIVKLLPPRFLLASVTGRLLLVRAYVLYSFLPHIAFKIPLK
jgi:hypothetical protein